jgi:CPA1 family monovalent cation:H+ antiporter
MRGIVSLATALALPVTAAGGAPFPQGEIIVIAMCVIIPTLVVQADARAADPFLAFTPEDTHHTEGRVARLEAVRGGAKALDELSR